MENDEKEDERKRKQHKVEKMDVDRKVDDEKKVILPPSFLQFCVSECSRHI